MIDTFDERYSIVTEAAVAAATTTVVGARPQGVIRCGNWSSKTRNHLILMGLGIQFL